MSEIGPSLLIVVADRPSRRTELGAKPETFLTVLHVSHDRLGLFVNNDNAGNSIGEMSGYCTCLSGISRTFSGRKWLRMNVDALFLSALLYELFRPHTTHSFRQNLVANLTRSYPVLHFRCLNEDAVDIQHLMVKVNVDWDRRIGVIDTLWNHKLDRLFHETAELENCMAWLSTLGGAYSSLGDSNLTSAETAGLLSLRQYRLAERLGDEITVFKCKLYLALSLMQLGHLSRAKRIIREQYVVASNLPDVKRDRRILNMCKGAWAKLKYYHSQKMVTSVDGCNVQTNSN